MVRDFIATALPTKAVCWTLVAANMVCDRDYVFMFGVKLWVGKKRVKKKAWLTFSLGLRGATTLFGKAEREKKIQSPPTWHRRKHARIG